MEEAVNFDFTDNSLSYDKILESLSGKSCDIRTYSPLVLAYVGDGVYELIIRSILVSRGNRAVQKISLEASRLVKAGTQAAFADMLEREKLLTKEEAEIYRRGRNANFHTKPKNASVNDYKKATGFEMLLGYLYMTGKNDRVLELVEKCLGMQHA